MMHRTGELPLKLPAPVVTPEQVEQLVAALRKAAGWMTAEEIALALPRKGTEEKPRLVPEREVRKIASAAAPSVVSYPGSPGYKLWAHCTVDEIWHAINAFEAQATDMIKRANLYRRAYHRSFRASS